MDEPHYVLGPTAGTGRLVETFGYIPTFRGSVISRVVMSREGPWIAMELVVNDLVREAMAVGILFSGVRECELRGLGLKNSIRFYETTERGGKAFTRIESVDGLGGFILSDAVRIESVKKA
jgi:hypothetical protein